MSKVDKVKIVEVGLRDGLQNEKVFLSVNDRVHLFDLLFSAGFKTIEAGSYVSPKWVPQMEGTTEIVSLLKMKYDFNKQVNVPILVPNLQGITKAVETGVKEVALFISATEAFSKANINCSIEDSLKRSKEVIKIAKKNKIKVRGYLSVCFGCPYEGNVDPKVVVKLAKELIKMGCYEVSIGDTIGSAYPVQVEKIFKMLKRVVPVKKLAGHFHDTRGLAIANIQKCLDLGIRIFDSSIGGLGGCPYAKGATGNVATEDVVYLCEQSGYVTGIDQEQLFEIHLWLEKLMKRNLNSKLATFIKKTRGLSEQETNS